MTRGQVQRIDPVALVARVRDHYIDQFRTFAERQRASCTQGGPEVKLQLSATSSLFRRFYCADFIKNDGAPEVVELQSDTVLTFQPIAGTFGGASLSIEHVQWDDVLIRHDLVSLDASKIADWFELWFDPEDARHDPDAELSGIVHSMQLQPNCISIDFGTAAPDAFWEILELLEDAGASLVEVSSSRAEATRDPGD